MTDLTGAELDLTVARVMGHEQIAIGQPGIVMHIDIDEWPPQAQGWRLCWRPSQGGAAAWEVLEWVRRQVNVVAVTIESDGNGGAVCMVAPAMSFDGPTYYGHGPTDAIALCHAVVALGEAG